MKEPVVHPSSLTLERKAINLYDADMVNNDNIAMNAPYKLFHDGVYYVCYLRISGNDRFLEIKRPEKKMSEVQVKNTY